MRAITLTVLCALLSACPPPTPSGGGGGGGGNRTGDAGPGSGPGSNGSIIGTWREDSTDAGDSVNLAFRDDGILLVLTDLATCSERDRIGYTAENNILTLTVQPDEPVPFRFEGGALILTTEDGEQRFVRAAQNCHTIAPSVSVVGTWEVLDSRRPDEPEALVFTENGLVFFLSDLSQCTPLRRYEYSTEGNQLTVMRRGTAQTDPYTVVDDVLTLSDSDGEPAASFERSRTNCHTRLQAGGDLPTVLIGTFTGDQGGWEGMAIRANNTLLILDNVEECIEDTTMSIYRYDDVLLINESVVLTWEQRGFNIALMSEREEEDLILTRTGSDCHSLP